MQSDHDSSAVRGWEKRLCKGERNSTMMELCRTIMALRRALHDCQTPPDTGAKRQRCTVMGHHAKCDYSATTLCFISQSFTSTAVGKSKMSEIRRNHSSPPQVCSLSTPSTRRSCPIKLRAGVFSKGCHFHLNPWKCGGGGVLAPPHACRPGASSNLPFDDDARP
jgi:hypothetical protein